jgi:fatty acid desaturase
MKARAEQDAGLGIAFDDATAIVKDLLPPRLRTYWMDFLASWGTAAATFWLAGRLPLFSIPQVAAFAISVLALYRAAVFVHEIVHQRRREFRTFRSVWNVLCGIPLLMPSYTYEVHLQHHTNALYGTAVDGEYVAWAHQPSWRMLMFLAGCVVLPVVGIARFMLLTPCAWLSRSVRDYADRRASALVIDPAYVRKPPLHGDTTAWRIQEALCFLYLAAVLAAVLSGWLPLLRAVQGILVLQGIALLNGFRVLGAHRYESAGEPVNLMDQLLDSINYPRWPLLTELWAPVGLRFHGLHHLFPSMPYHALGEAHRRLMLRLPERSVYRKTISNGLVSSLSRLWRNSRRASGVLKLGGNTHGGKPRSAARPAS